MQVIRGTQDVFKKSLSEQFPSTRFQGSKRKILPWLYENLKELDFHTVLDGMGGSTSVSYLLKKMGKEVTYNDYMLFGSVMADALIVNNNESISDELLQWTLQDNTGVDYGSVIARNYSGYYYTDEENKLLDRIVSNILALDESALLGDTWLHKKSLLWYALIQSCLIKRPFNLFHRKNLYLRTNRVNRSFGNKQTWDRSLGHYMTQFTREANKFIFDNGRGHRSINKSIFEVEGDFDLVYLDPPYFRESSTNETSNYNRIYHFLEGIVNYENWLDHLNEQSRIRMYGTDRHKDKFTKSNVKEKIEELFVKYQDSIVVMSYKRGGVPSIDFITELAGKLFNTVKVTERKYSYALNRQNGDARFNREVLIIAR